jgi:hypothetical protein
VLIDAATGYLPMIGLVLFASAAQEKDPVPIVQDEHEATVVLGFVVNQQRHCFFSYGPLTAVCIQGNVLPRWIVFLDHPNPPNLALAILRSSIVKLLRELVL